MKLTNLLTKVLIGGMVVISAKAMAQGQPCLNSNLLCVANPAAQRCVKLGGKSIAFTTEAGGQLGACAFGMGVIEEWTLYKIDEHSVPTQQALAEYFKPVPREEYDGASNPASKSCMRRGATAMKVFDANRGESGFCVFQDGSMVEEWTLYRGAEEKVNSKLTKVIGHF